MARHTHALTLLMVALMCCSSARSARAQSHPFVFSVATGREAHAAGITSQADLGYGHDLFEALGPESMESRVGVQIPMRKRVLLLGQFGWASGGDGTTDHLTAQLEGLVDVLPMAARASLAVGMGVRRDHDGTGEALGRIVAGYRWDRTTAVANLRLERAGARAGGAQRDKLDVITSLGLAREFRPGLRIGLESVAEDLEGLFDPEEAEGGAKLMMGPHVRLGEDDARWHMLIAGGPVFQLSQSSALAASPAPRDLATRTGYVARMSIDYRW